MTGSFKARGALNKILSLDKESLQKGVITASTGNHAMGFANAIKILNRQNPADASQIKAQIYLPKNVAPVKLEGLKKMVAGTTLELVLHGGEEGSDKPTFENELEAKRVTDLHKMTYVSPYNDVQVAGGQGTIAAEILD